MDTKKAAEILSNEETAEKTENANINGYSFMGKMLHLGEETSKQYALENLLSPEDRLMKKDLFIYMI